MQKLSEPLEEALGGKRCGPRRDPLVDALVELAAAVTKLALAVDASRVVQGVSNIEVKDG